MTAETIIINTGAVPTILPICGLAESKFAVDSTGIQRLEKLPKRLGVMVVDQSDWNLLISTIPWASQVTVLDASETFCHGSRPALQLLQKATLKKMAFNSLQGVHTPEIKDGETA